MTHATQPIGLDPLLAMSYRSLAQLETLKRLRAVPMAALPPNALFGADARKGAAAAAGGEGGLAGWM